MPCAALHADNLLYRFPEYVAETNVAAAYRTIHACDSARVVWICGIADEINDTWGVDPVLSEIVKAGKQAPQINRGHVAEFVIQSAAHTITSPIIEVLTEVSRARTEKHVSIG